MNHLRILAIALLLTAWLVYPGTCVAQLSKGGVPPSFNYELKWSQAEKIAVQPPDLSNASMEDEIHPSPYRFGIIVPIDISPAYSGSWSILPDGKKIWRATVSAPGALAVSAYFDRFRIPEGGRLYIYNSDRSQVIGAFTPINNSRSGLFATELIGGEEMTLEYINAEGNELVPQIHMNEMTYAYRGVEYLDKQGYIPFYSGKCEVNVNP